MSGYGGPTLDSLMQSPQPAWLWDAERACVVWCNMAGARLWQAESAFDLAERRFSPRDPGVARLGTLARQLEAGGAIRTRLAPGGTSAGSPVECTCYFHELSDGRAGLLVVAALASDAPDGGAAGLPLRAFDALASGVVVLDRAGDVVFCNAAARDLWAHGLPAALADIVLTSETADALLAEAKATGLASRVIDIETRFGRRAHRMHLEALAREPGRDQDSPARYVLQLDDVADRRALERRLSDDVARLTALVETAATVTFELGADLTVAAIRGDAVEGLAGKAWQSTAEAYGLDPEGAIAAALGRRAAWREIVPWPAADGVRPTMLSAEPRFDDGGTFSGYRVVGTLVAAGGGGGAGAKAPDTRSEPERGAAIPKLSPEDTDAFRRIGETLTHEDTAQPQALEEEDEPDEIEEEEDPARPGPGDDDLRTILDTATDGVLTFDEEGRIAALNASAQAIFGVDTQEAAGMPIFELLSPKSAQTVRDYLSALSDSGLSRIFNEGREVVAVEKGGTEIPLFMTIGRIRGGTGRPGRKARYCAVIRDITQWKRTEQELRRAKDEAERANAQKSEFLANISHELRTPLNAIIGFSEVMKTEKFGTISNDRYRGYVTDIHASGEHLLSLINDLLDLSKVEAGKLELNFTSVDLSDIIQQCIGIIQEHATRERIIIRTSVSDRLPNVVADQRSMRQILLNLLSNAVKFTDPGGQVIVSALMDDSGQVKLLVKDTGVGMSPEELVQAMEPFQRVERTQRSETPGTGLGLPLTKALAEANRASFAIESEPGRGTRVEITFPTTRVLAD